MISEDKYNALIVRHLDNELSGEELNDLLKWLKEDDQHFRYYLELKDIWYSGELLYSCEDIAEKALMRFREKYQPNEARRSLTTKMIRIGWQIAATLILAFLFSLSWQWLTREKPVPEAENSFATVYMPRGQKGQVTLNDGTRIWLNSNSILKYPSGFCKGSRKIILDGEAFMEVTKDPAHPFLVETSSVTLRVLGTSFNVKCFSKENTVETTLIEGSLEILAGHSGVRRLKKVVLKPNEKAIFQKNSNQFSVNELDKPDQKLKKLQCHIKKSPVSISEVESIISWKDNHLIFKDESFEEIASKMEAWYGVDIRIEDEKLKGYRFTGKFVYNETIDQVMKVISFTTPLQYSLNKNILTIRSK
jgi:ferric-dicitrate binding protein FerR (iron transport regulator)